nr:MAG TPA: hypothetical protein [Bacteriophage sp.]
MPLFSLKKDIILQQNDSFHFSNIHRQGTQQ